MPWLTNKRFLVLLLAVFGLVQLVQAARVSAAGTGSVQAVDLTGDYLGTYTPNGGNPTQLQAFLEDSAAGPLFTGEGNVRNPATQKLDTFDIEGSLRRRRGRIEVNMSWTAQASNDTYTLRGTLNRRRGRISGDVPRHR